MVYNFQIYQTTSSFKRYAVKRCLWSMAIRLRRTTALKTLITVRESTRVVSPVSSLMIMGELRVLNWNITTRPLTIGLRQVGCTSNVARMTFYTRPSDNTSNSPYKEEECSNCFINVN